MTESNEGNGSFAPIERGTSVFPCLPERENSRRRMLGAVYSSRKRPRQNLARHHGIEKTGERSCAQPCKEMDPGGLSGIPARPEERKNNCYCCKAACNNCRICRAPGGIGGVIGQGNSFGCGKMRRFFRRLFVLPIRFYQIVISPALPSSCRFYPTCSQYAIEAIEKRGVFVGIFLAGKRLLRCHPWGGFGYDPVPERTRKKKTKPAEDAGQRE